MECFFDFKAEFLDMKRWRKKEREGLVMGYGQQWWKVGNDYAHNLVCKGREGRLLKSYLGTLGKMT